MTIPNFDDAPFMREGVVDVDAAIVGIRRTRWKAIDGNKATNERALACMRRHRFDVLPIEDGPEVTRYFRTNTWGVFSDISEERITHRDVIPFNTNIRDVIKSFAEDEERNFYFLANKRRITGLISVVNLNCRQVSVFLFSLLSELEVLLAVFVEESSEKSGVSEETLRDITFGETVKGKHIEVQKRYEANKLKE